jgi:hypothetical protein
MDLIDRGGSPAGLFVRVRAPSLGPQLSARRADGVDTFPVVRNVDRSVRSDDRRRYHVSGIKFPFQIASGVQRVEESVFARSI